MLSKSLTLKPQFPEEGNKKSNSTGATDPFEEEDEMLARAIAMSLEEFGEEELAMSFKEVGQEELDVFAQGESGDLFQKLLTGKGYLS